MYKLYGRPGSGSFVIEAMLAEAGAECELITIERDQERRPPTDFLAINPLGQVPVLILPGGEVMTESAAMVIYLADRYPQAGLAPSADAPERAKFLRWLLFMATNIYTSDIRYYYSPRYTSDPHGADGVKAAAFAHLAREWDILAAELGDRPYLVGEMSAADLYAAMLATWSPDLAVFYAKHRNVDALCARIKSRPRIAPIWQRHRMDG